ncbi:MAG: helix-turn-helix transcriptional regulator [Candidatus Limnocylindrales bacterium]
MFGTASPDELLELADQMLEAARVSGSPYVELLGLTWRIDGFLRQGDSRRAGHAIDALDVLAARTEGPLFRWNALFDRAGLEQAVGRFGDAERTARSAAKELPESQAAQTQPLLIAQLMLVATDRGVAPPEIEMVRGFVVGAPMIAVSMTARFDLEVRDRARAQATFEAIRHRISEVDLDRRGLPTLAAASELAVAFDDTVVGSTLLVRLQPFSGVMIASALGVVGPTDYFIARLEGILGGRDDAVHHAQASLDLSAHGGFGPWIARSRLGLGVALARRDGPGDRPAARLAAAMAAESATELGMGHLHSLAVALTDELAGPRLTPREREVAGFVARGASNREIAGALVLSDRTVESHVEHVMTKLGFHSRSQIAAWMAVEESESRV